MDTKNRVRRLKPEHIKEVSRLVRLGVQPDKIGTAIEEETGVFLTGHDVRNVHAKNEAVEHGDNTMERLQSVSLNLLL